MNKKTLFVVAAGSGGHILPALTHANKWLKQNADGTIIFFTGTSALERKIVKTKQFIAQAKHLHLSKFSLRRWWILPLILVQLIIIFIMGFGYALWYRPTAIVSTGGLLSVPFCFAARLTRRSVEIYELNVTPGKAVKLLLPVASVIHTVFPETKMVFLSAEKCNALSSSCCS